VRGEATALDVCTGSGNLAVGMAAAVPAARVLASDLSEEAVGLARRNVAHLGLGSRVEVRQGDLLDPFRDPELLGGVDVLVCNPPYISSGKLPSMPAEIARFEPSLAFDGGPFGIRFLVRLIKEAPLFLRPSSGWLAFEVGAGQGPSALNRLNAGGRFADVHTLKDEQGQVRAIVSRLAAN
jgi:release factor glutamine methyltransferase